MKNQKTGILLALLYIALLSACFSPWTGNEDAKLKYTVTLTSDDESIDVKSTRVTPIVISVPRGTWNIEVRADATEKDDFAETSLRFVGQTDIKVSADEEKITLDTSAMTPSIQVKTGDQLSKAFKEWGNYLDRVGWKPKSGSPECYIEIIDNLQANDTATLNEDKNIVLWAEKDVTIKRGTGGSLFQVKKGTLTLGRNDQETSGQGDNITITGNKNTGNNALIMVSGTLFMYNGVTLTGNEASGNTGNYNNGGGVFVANGGKFFMEGGKISSNFSDPKDMPNDNAGGGGGVYVDTGGEFTMNGGTISDNKTTGHGGGVRVYQGGIFTMNGGTISDNIVDTANSLDNGGGVRVRGTFFMNGGTLSDNKAPSGGGVSVGDSGGGSGTFTMKGGTIFRNTTTSTDGNGNGGGVRVYGGVNNSGVYGGGIFTKTGGTISGSDGGNNNPPNIANGKGNAVYAQNGKEDKSKNITSGPENKLSSSPGVTFGTGWDQ